MLREIDQPKNFSPEFKKFLAESAADEGLIDHIVYHSPRLVQQFFERHLPWMLSEGYHKAQRIYPKPVQPKKLI